MTRRLLIAGLVAALTLPVGLGAQEEPAAAGEITLPRAEERLRARLGDEAARRVVEAVERAGERGVPLRPLLSKALEGAAKGVPADRIGAAVSSYAGRLERSIGLVGPERGPDVVVAGADALGRGVPSDQVRRVARSSPADRGAVPLVVLGDLVEAGVPADRAAETVGEAVRQGVSGDALLRMPDRVRRMIRRGVPPAHAAERARGAAARRGPPAGAPGGPPGGAGGGPGDGPPVPPGSGPPGDPPGKGKGGGSGGGPGG